MVIADRVSCYVLEQLSLVIFTLYLIKYLMRNKYFYLIRKDCCFFVCSFERPELGISVWKTREREIDREREKQRKRERERERERESITV